VNNKPVAWAMFVDGDFWDAIHPEEHDRVEGKYTVPLYTHPAKTLTDEEIDKEIEYAIMQGYGSSYVEGLADGFERARAILRKAQEK
jgi:hypothetical protein